MIHSLPTERAFGTHVGKGGYPPLTPQREGERGKGKNGKRGKEKREKGKKGEKMKALSIRIKTAEKKEHRYLVHDFRLYSPESIPSYIDPERTSRNIFLIRNINPETEAEAKELIGEIEGENRELFKELKEKGYIAKNQGYKLKSHLAHGILTLSHEAQEELKEDPRKMEDFLERAKDYLQTLAGALGTDLFYAVVHLDETAPHIHFAMRNLRTREPDHEACERVGLDYEVMKEGVGKSITGTFYGESVKAKSRRPYMVHFSQLQDTLDYFEPIGFGRGTPKKEREARGEPWWKVANRSVRQLHEDLPKELRLKEKELKRLEREIERKKEELRKAEEKLMKIENGKKKLTKELVRLAKELEVRKEEKGILRKENYIPVREFVRYMKAYVESVADYFAVAGKEIAGAREKVKQVETLEERARLLEKQVERLVEELNRELDERLKLEEEVEQLREENERLRKEIKSLRGKELEEEQPEQQPEQGKEEKESRYRRVRKRLR